LRKAVNKDWGTDEADSWVTKPAKIRSMTAEEATAGRMFKENMDLDDPMGTKRRVGVYGQIFERAGDKMPLLRVEPSSSEQISSSSRKSLFGRMLRR
jgi:hypothetical protein